MKFKEELYEYLHERKNPQVEEIIEMIEKHMDYKYPMPSIAYRQIKEMLNEE